MQGLKVGLAMVLVIIGALLIVGIAPFTYVSTRHILERKGETPPRSLVLFPIAQVSGGLVAIAIGVNQLTR